jgi:hypothetical protein
MKSDNSDACHLSRNGARHKMASTCGFNTCGNTCIWTGMPWDYRVTSTRPSSGRKSRVLCTSRKFIAAFLRARHIGPTFRIFFARLFMLSCMPDSIAVIYGLRGQMQFKELETLNCRQLAYCRDNTRATLALEVSVSTCLLGI